MPFSITSPSRRDMVEMWVVKSMGDECVTDMQNESRNNKYSQGNRVGEGDEKRENDCLAVMNRTMSD